MIFTPFKMLCNHRLCLAPERVHPPKGKLASIEQSLPIPSSPRPLATTDLLSISMDLPSSFSFLLNLFAGLWLVSSISLKVPWDWRCCLHCSIMTSGTRCRDTVGMCGGWVAADRCMRCVSEGLDWQGQVWTDLFLSARLCCAAWPLPSTL